MVKHKIQSTGTLYPLGPTGP